MSALVSLWNLLARGPIVARDRARERVAIFVEVPTGGARIEVYEQALDDSARFRHLPLDARCATGLDRPGLATVEEACRWGEAVLAYADTRVLRR